MNGRSPHYKISYVRVVSLSKKISVGKMIKVGGKDPKNRHPQRKRSGERP